MNRRQFLQCSGASLMLWPLTSTAMSPSKIKKKKLVFIMLRGALDALHTIVPTSDETLVKLRPKLSSGAKEALLRLNNDFALHPSLKTMHNWYQQNMLLPIVATGSGYGKRSHFDGQDYLESGLNQIDHDTGWLGRAVAVTQKMGLAVNQTTPIVFRSAQDVKTWYPNNLKAADDDIFGDLIDLYQGDPALMSKLQDGLKTKALIADATDKKKNKDRFVELAKACGQLLAAEHGPDCAMLEMGGWDTHNNQAGRLKRKLSELDTGLAALQASLKQDWQDTVVIVASEFGRTVRENGTGGTDHGTGSCLFVAGGGLNGGHMLGDWPGLKPEQLFENRDLKPTSNTFSWIAALLSEHWQLSAGQLQAIFPNHEPYLPPYHPKYSARFFKA